MMILAVDANVGVRLVVAHAGKRSLEGAIAKFDDLVAVGSGGHAGLSRVSKKFCAGQCPAKRTAANFCGLPFYSLGQRRVCAARAVPV